MAFEISETVKYALETLEASGYEAYIVGGSVRDMIINSCANDFDITTNANPDEIKKVFFKHRVIETGIKHGTVTVVINDENIEITTYRSEGEYSDFRHPDNVEFTISLEEDLKRRDFTINSLVCNSNGEIIDTFGGIIDIKNKIIRAIGDPEKRFFEDALRVLRGIRFSSVLGFKIEENTKNAMIKHKHLLKKISSERISTEINKFLCGKNVKNAILENYEVLSEIIPEIEKMHQFNQNNEHHIYDLLTHTAVVTQNIEPVLHLRLSAFLHDTGKTMTYSVGSDGQGHFYDHPSKSYEVAKKFFDDYKYDNFTKERALALIKVHDTPIEENPVYIKKRLNRMGKELFFDLLKLQRADNSAQSPKYDRKKHFDIVEGIAKEIIDTSECFSLKNLEISGSDLIYVGFEKGKKIGQILDFLLQEVIEGKIKNKKDDLIEKAKDVFELDKK